jgi:hypothetical protein
MFLPSRSRRSWAGPACVRFSSRGTQRAPSVHRMAHTRRQLRQPEPDPTARPRAARLSGAPGAGGRRVLPPRRALIGLPVRHARGRRRGRAIAGGAAGLHPQHSGRFSGLAAGRAAQRAAVRPHQAEPPTPRRSRRRGGRHHDAGERARHRTDAAPARCSEYAPDEVHPRHEARAGRFRAWQVHGSPHDLPRRRQQASGRPARVGAKNEPGALSVSTAN